MLISILEWLASFILNYILGKATTAAKEKLEDLEKERKRGEINEDNIKAYEQALDRKSRIEEAQRLLNRSKR